MSKYEVRRNTIIHRSCSDIIEYLCRFDNWPTWSPWLILEPDCTLEYQSPLGQIGSGYLWDGKLIGAGNMTLIVKDESRLEMALHFIRPFKSHAHVRFEILQNDDTSLVTWIMTSELPWYLFFMKNTMKAIIGMDFERGLLMLKSQLETGQVLSTLKVIGEQHQKTQHYIGLKGRSKIASLGEVVQSHIARLKDFFQLNQLELCDPWFCLYESMDKQTTETEFFTCFPISHEIDVPAPFVCDQLGNIDGFVVEHIGSYSFLGNAWSLAMMASRQQKFKPLSKPMGIEKYINSENETDSSKLITEVILFKS